jgi:hypothetical protein
MPNDPKKPRGLSDDQWAEVQAKFGSGSSISELEREYGVRRATIRDRAKREGWTVQVTVQVDGVNTGQPLGEVVQKRARANVIDIATKRAIEQIEASGAVDEAAGTIAEELIISRRLALKMAQAMESFIDGVVAKEYKPSDAPATRDMAQFMKDVQGAYKIHLSTIREDAGLKSGQATVAKDDADNKVSEVAFRIVRESTGTEG